MKLSVYSLKNILFEGDATSVNCTTEGGEVTILDRHEPLIATLKPGTLTIKDAGGKDHFIPTGKGFLEVTAENTARILADEPRE
ncbi:MAG: F0F1 ATP synthase subunit epsilon [Candidatus Liptonbacteria bacterium]|nr:F0F1 ATP synthase subunit epsilon [Candidatus Liptonbacteria bacterium]MBI3114656.1 F0F1 ATP synthase subunit epsilon [Candidatus Harrisonbacteria bacterium]